MKEHRIENTPGVSKHAANGKTRRSLFSATAHAPSRGRRGQPRPRRCMEHSKGDRGGVADSVEGRRNAQAAIQVQWPPVSRLKYLSLFARLYVRLSGRHRFSFPVSLVHRACSC